MLGDSVHHARCFVSSARLRVLFMLLSIKHVSNIGHQAPMGLSAFPSLPPTSICLTAKHRGNAGPHDMHFLVCGNYLWFHWLLGVRKGLL